MRLEDEGAANKIQVPGNCLKVTPTDLKINSQLAKTARVASGYMLDQMQA